MYVMTVGECGISCICPAGSKGRPYPPTKQGHYYPAGVPGLRRREKASPTLHPPSLGQPVLPKLHCQEGWGQGDKVVQQESQKALPSQLPHHKKPDSSRGPDPFQIYIPLPVARHCSPTSGCSASSLSSLTVPPLEQSGWWSLGLQLTSPSLPAFVILSDTWDRVHFSSQGLLLLKDSSLSSHFPLLAFSA